MGHTQALGMAEAVRDGMLSLDAALQYHLQHNHYPPMPYEAIGTAKRAIERCAAGEPEDGYLQASRQIVKLWHLEPFVDAMSDGHGPDDCPKGYIGRDGQPHCGCPEEEAEA